MGWTPDPRWPIPPAGWMFWRAPEAEGNVPTQGVVIPRQASAVDVIRAPGIDGVVEFDGTTLAVTRESVTSRLVHRYAVTSLADARLDDDPIWLGTGRFTLIVGDDPRLVGHEPVRFGGQDRHTFERLVAAITASIAAHRVLVGHTCHTDEPRGPRGPAAVSCAP